jgi:tetratricopeptide (TPR) repeat protein
MLLNFKRLNLGWLCAWLAINVLSVWYGHVAVYAAIVNATVATLCGQDWYRQNFSMAYSIKWPSVLFARGGRAVTVLSLFSAAYLAVNGALMGAGGRRIGLGLDPRWRDRLSNLERSVLANTPNDRVFPMTPALGDLLIFLGKPPFLDTRYALYLDGSEDLLEVYERVRKSLIAGSNPKEGEPDLHAWEPIFDQYQLTEVLLRLWGDRPSYQALGRLMADPRWSLSGLGAAGAKFSRVDLNNAAQVQYAAELRNTRFVREAFRPTSPAGITELGAVWPTPPTVYDHWLIQKLPRSTASAQLGRHYEEIRKILGPSLSAQQATGLAYLAIRECRRALAEDPNNPFVYRTLLSAYGMLQQIEQRTVLAPVDPTVPSFYATQILEAAFRAVQTGNDDPGDLLRLFEVLFNRQEVDVTFEILRRYENAVAKRPQAEAPSDQREQIDRLRQRLNDQLQRVNEEIEKARAEGADRERLIQIGYRGHCPLLILSIMEEELASLIKSPDGKLLYCSLLMRVGRTKDAWEVLELLTSDMTLPNLPPDAMPTVSRWRLLKASANLAIGNVAQAISLWSEQPQQSPTSEALSLLQQPFAACMIPVQQDLWAAAAAWTTGRSVVEGSEQRLNWQMQVALAELEAGQLAGATQHLQDILKEFPQFSRRGTIAFYLNMLTTEAVNPIPRDETVLPEFQLDLAAPASPAQSPLPSTESGPQPPALPEPIPGD